MAGQTVIPFPDRPALPDPSPLVWVMADLWWELRETERKLRRARTLPCLRLVPDDLEPEWDSEDSNSHQDRVEAGLEPEWPDD